MNSHDTLLQKTKEKLKSIKLPQEARRISLIILVLLIMDIIVSWLTPFLQAIDFFSGKSELRILSDLLFLEGSLIFSVGAFWGFLTRDFRSRLAIIMLIITLGGCFVGSSILIGELFLRH